MEDDEELVTTSAINSSHLPIRRFKREIQYIVEKNPVSIVIGATGSGKSTQMPQFLLPRGGTVIAVQPRRMAAISLAKRVAHETNSASSVGYTVRFEDTCTERTRIRFMTDGMLLREMMWDPLLSKASTVILDEAHERSVGLELLAGLIRKILPKRPELRLVIASATLEADSLRAFFGQGTAVVSIPGRHFPVGILYATEPVADYVAAAAECVSMICKQRLQGDILVFVASVDEIHRVLAQLDSAVEALPLHASLSLAEQMAVFAPPAGKRRVIVATNVAEASVTIEGVVHVVDCGRVKSRVHQHGVEQASVGWCSRASAVQRAGRAGRVQPGHVYRLYTEQEYARMPESAPSELHKVDLAPVVLQLKAFGIDRVGAFGVPSGWPAEGLAAALESLHGLSILDNKAALTSIGVRIADLPLPHPAMGRMIMAGHQLGCLQETLRIAAFLAVQSGGMFDGFSEHSVKRFAVRQGDLITALNIYTGYARAASRPAWCQKHHMPSSVLSRVHFVADLLRRHLHALPMSSTKSVEPVQRAILTAYARNAAHADFNAGHYRLLLGDGAAHIHPSSVLFRHELGRLVVGVGLEEASSGKVFIRGVTQCDNPEWLAEQAPSLFALAKRRH